MIKYENAVSTLYENWEWKIEKYEENEGKYVGTRECVGNLRMNTYE